MWCLLRFIWIVSSCFLVAVRCEKKRGSWIESISTLCTKFNGSNHTWFKFLFGTPWIELNWFHICNVVCVLRSVWFSRPCGNWYVVQFVHLKCGYSVVKNHIVLNERYPIWFLGVHAHMRRISIFSSMEYYQIDVWLGILLKPSIPDAFHTFHCFRWHNRNRRCRVCVCACNAVTSKPKSTIDYCDSFTVIHYMMCTDYTCTVCVILLVWIVRSYKLSHYSMFIRFMLDLWQKLRSLSYDFVFWRNEKKQQQQQHALNTIHYSVHRARKNNTLV